MKQHFNFRANNIVTRYPDYSVTFSGLGEGPIGSENLGYCSQMALFTRKDLMNEKYTLKEYSIYCICSNESQCKGLNSTFLACKCVCPCCSPKSSYGVCTYYSYSKQITHEDQVENTSGNIFYKAIETVSTKIVSSMFNFRGFYYLQWIQQVIFVYIVFFFFCSKVLFSI